MQIPTSAPLRTMVARVSPDDMVIYANAALATYLRVPKRLLTGSPLDVLAARCHGEVASCFSRPESGRTSNRLVTDDEGRVFEAKAYSDGGVLDIVLDEVTTADSVGRELKDSSGTPVESLSEEELRTARHPERRYLTISMTRLVGLSKVVDRLAPMESRLMVNAFVEEACDAVFDVGCTVGETTGDSVLGIYGAPRYFADHPFRALRAACEQMSAAAQLRAGFWREGKELPPCACGLWTGETVVGTLGNSLWQHYTAIGATVDFAARLAALARAGEVLLPEHTLHHVLKTLPDGWQWIQAESESGADLSDFQWTDEGIEPTAENLRRIVYLIGPGIEDHTERVEYYLEYLYAIRLADTGECLPILRVTRPSVVGESVELSDNNVVTTLSAQMLGKYRLIEVVGSGGMGKVWRGVDRFGNAVAIKVLHATETEAQLRRFRREAEIMARLPHRNICRVYEMNEFEGITYIAMEFVDGLPLADLLYEKTNEEQGGRSTSNANLRNLIHSLRADKAQREHQVTESMEAPPRPKETRILPLEQTFSIFLKVCDAVQFAHEHGVLHRDLKPGNILLREDGEPLVADFGLAKLNTSDATQSLSVTGHVVGTLENMAPEQAESSKTVDERADVYSLGTILYQMLTGRRHFEATGNIVSDATALRTHEPVRPRALHSAIHPDLEIITLKALRAEPEERYRTVEALMSDIEHFRRGEVISAKAVSPVELLKKLIERNKAVTAVLAGSLIVIVLATVFFFWQLAQRLEAEQQARTDAERQRQLAEEQQKLADQHRVRAEQNAAAAEAERLIATEAKNRADRAREEALAAQKAAEEALAARSKAEEEKQSALVAQTEAERLAQERGEQLRSAQEQVEQIKAETEKSRTAENALPPPPPPDAFEQAKRFHGEAMTIYNLQLSPPELQRLDRTPQEVVRRITNAQDLVSQALMIEPKFTPAWLLKGRLHLAAVEYAQALRAFEQAVATSTGRPEILRGDDPVAMRQIAEELTKVFGDKASAGAEALKGSPLPMNFGASAALEFLSEKPALMRSSTAATGPLLRTMAPNEIALEILLAGADTASVRLLANNSVDVSIPNAGKLTSLAMLRGIDVSQLTLNGASAVDWDTLATLPLESLNLDRCSIQAFSPNTRAFMRMRALSLNGTDLASADFARGMPLLQSLAIADTHVTDLTPLTACRHLRSLDLTGTHPVSLAPLLNLAMESITLSPLLITDPTALAQLRGHRTLKFLRSPGDPEDFPAAAFWKKLDSGGYNASE